MSFKRALFILILLVLAVGTIPAGIVAYARLARALEDGVRESLTMAPELLASRWTATVDVRMMHARDLARTAGLAEALRDGDEARAASVVEQAGSGFPEAPVLVGKDGTAILAPDTLPPDLLGRFTSCPWLQWRRLENGSGQPGAFPPWMPERRPAWRHSPGAAS
jgi:hypothetical protein